METKKSSPHLPPNYVTLKQLQERRFKEEEVDRLRKLKEAEEEEARGKQAAAAAAAPPAPAEAKERRRNHPPPRPEAAPEKLSSPLRALGSNQIYRVKQQPVAPVSNPAAGNQEGEKDAGDERKPRRSKKPGSRWRKQPPPPDSTPAAAGDRKPHANDSSDNAKVDVQNGANKEADRVEPKKKNYGKKKRIRRKSAPKINAIVEEIAPAAKEEVKEVSGRSLSVPIVTSRGAAGRENEVVEKIGGLKIVGSNVMKGEANGGKEARGRRHAYGRGGDKLPSEINENVEEIAPPVKEEDKKLMEEVSAKSLPVLIVTSRGEAGRKNGVVEKIGGLKIVGSNVMKGEANGGKAARGRRHAYGRGGNKLPSEIDANVEEIAPPVKEENKSLPVPMVTSRGKAGRENGVVEKIGGLKIVGSNVMNGEVNGGKARGWRQAYGRGGGKVTSEINANLEEIAPLAKAEVKKPTEEVLVKPPPVSVVTSPGEAGRESEVVEKIQGSKIVGGNVMNVEANGRKAARGRRPAYGRGGRKSTSFRGRPDAAAGAGMVWVKKAPDS